MELPSRLGDYCLVEKLAQGGMAEIYLGLDASSRVVAIKCLKPELAKRTQFLEMFVSEGRMASLLDHPNIVETYGLEETGEQPFIVMEYLLGKELRAVTRHLTERGQRLHIGSAIWIMESVLAALDHAHHATDSRGLPLNLVNRDVSPTNIVLTYAGEVKLIDFGIAQTTVGFTTQIGHIKGKIAYMSPEQVRGLPVDPRSDVFSAGIVLHELLTGRRLFTGPSDFALMEAVKSQEIPLPSQYNSLVDPRLDEIVLTALARDPAARYQSAGEFREALERYRAERDLMFGSQELAEFLTTTFAKAYREDMARVERISRFSPTTCAAESGQEADEPLTGAGNGGADVRRDPQPMLAPILVGVLVGLVVSALIYWLLIVR